MSNRIDTRAEAYTAYFEGSEQVYPLPCTKCGKCCKTEVCPIGEILLDSSIPPCSALENQDGKYWCGLVRNPTLHLSPSLGLTEWRPAALAGYLKELFAFGVGCDSSDA